MSKVLVVLDSISYELFDETETPAMDSLGDVHEAFSWGQWTIPSVAAMLMGFLPHCTVENCFHNKLFPIPIYQPIPKNLESGKHVHVYTSNPYIALYMKPIINRNPRFHFHYYDVQDPYTQKAVKHLLSRKHEFFAFLHVMECHRPYYDGEKWTPNWKTVRKPSHAQFQREIQKASLRYLDRMLKPLIDSNLEIILTSDHGELFRSDAVGHPAILDLELFKVPIISRAEVMRK